MEPTSIRFGGEATSKMRLRNRSVGLFAGIFGLILLMAAALKVHELTTTNASQLNFAFSLGWSSLEASFGIWLVCGARTRITHAILICLTVVFGVVSLIKVLNGEENCGCFGLARVPPIVILFLDAVLGVFFACNRHSFQKPATAKTLSIATALSVITVSTIIATTWSNRMSRTDFSGIGMESNGLVVLEPYRWVGNTLELVKQCKISADLTKDEWQILLVDTKCNKCRLAYMDFCSIPRSSSASLRRAVIWTDSIPPKNSELETGANGVVVGQLSMQYEWVGDFPMIISTDDGKCTSYSLHGHGSAK